jgi:hypothetical protein
MSRSKMRSTVFHVKQSYAEAAAVFFRASRRR